MFAYGPADATAVRGRVRSLHMAKLQAASVPITWGSCAPTAAVPWDRQTDRQTDGRNAVSLNAPPPYGGGHNSWLHYPIHRRHSSGDWATTHRPRHRSKAEHEPSRARRTTRRRRKPSPLLRMRRLMTSQPRDATRRDTTRRDAEPERMKPMKMDACWRQDSRRRSRRRRRRHDVTRLRVAQIGSPYSRLPPRSLNMTTSVTATGIRNVVNT